MVADHSTSEVPAITTKGSPRSVDDTVSKLVELIEAQGMKIFVVIDQSAEALRAGIDLRPTALVVFGNPIAGTRVMEAAPLAALDLPLKVLVWADGEDTKVSYWGADALGARYRLPPDIVANLAGIEPLTDALVAP